MSDGGKGSYYGHNNLVNYVPAFKTEEIDATGAGDAMLAGIITKIIDMHYEDKLKTSYIEQDSIREFIKAIILLRYYFGGNVVY